MKKLYQTLSGLAFVSLGCKQVSVSCPGNVVSCTPSESIYEFKMKLLDGTEVDFSQFKGKKILIVNTASKCGYTYQYAELQKLHEQYGDKVVLLGFPSNDFLREEPGSNSEIKEFCTRNYGVSFRMFEKIEVKGKNQCPLYQWLSTKQLNGWNNKQPKWNFCKYLISEKGELLTYFPSAIRPMSKELIDALSK